MALTLRIFGLVALTVGLLLALLAALFTEPADHKAVSVVFWLFGGLIVFAVFTMLARNAAYRKR